MLWRIKLWRIRRQERAFERAWAEYRKTVTPPVLGIDRVAFRQRWESR